MDIREFSAMIHNVKKGANGEYTGACPYCESNNPKGHHLSFRFENDKILMDCKHGCTCEEICSALKISVSQLFESPTSYRKQSPQKIRDHTYCDEHGNPVAKKTIYRKASGGKTACWMRWKGSQWEKGLNGYKPPLYNLPKVISEPDTVYIAEGEKDAETLEKMGFTATTSPNGAKEKGKSWNESHNKYLFGKKVVILQDNDIPGTNHARQTAFSLLSIAKSVKLINPKDIFPDLPNKGDISDVAAALGEGTTKEKLLKLLEQTKEYEPQPEPVQISESGQEITTPQRGEWLTLAGFRGFLQGAGLAVKYNVLTKRLDFTGDLRGVSSGNAANILPAMLSDEIRSAGVKGCNTERIREFLAVVGELERYNPVKMYLDGLQWDKIDRFPLLYGALGIESDSKYQNYLKKWLIQCVALGLNNEDKPTGAEGVLVLAGAQGCGKTAFFRNLCPDGLFTEGAALDVSSTGAGKDSLLKALGGWICELGELDSTTRKEQPALKAFITSPWDEIRTPYAVAATRSARRTSFAGTVNGTGFLVDCTGSRRFWTIPVSDMDLNFIIDLLPEMREQIWAQAFQMYKENPQGFRLDSVEREALQADNRAFEMLLPFETEIRAELDFDMDFSEWVWRSAADIRHSEAVPKNADSRQIGKAMQRIAAELEREVPEGEKVTRTVHGLKQYKLPFKAF